MKLQIGLIHFQLLVFEANIFLEIIFNYIKKKEDIENIGRTVEDMNCYDPNFYDKRVWNYGRPRFLAAKPSCTFFLFQTPTNPKIDN